MAQEAMKELEDEKFVPSDAPAAEGDPPKVTIDLNEADEEPDEPKVQDGPRPPRHKSQWRQLKEQHERELAELKEKLNMLEGRVSTQPPVVQQIVQPPRDATQDPTEQEIQSIWRNQQRTLAAIRSGQFSDAEIREMENDWRQLDRRRRALEAKADNPRQREEAAPDPHAYAREILSAEYPEIYSKKSLRQMAEAEFEALREMGKPDNIVTAREALERVAARRGIGRKPPPPSDAERARHAGIPGRAGATPGGAQGQYTPTKYIMELARAYTSHLPDLTDEERYKHWRRYVGKKEGLVP
jgi:hypothetical protein